MGNGRKYRRLLDVRDALGLTPVVDTRPGASAVAEYGCPDIGDVNGYRCRKCEHYIFVVHKDKGVTPMYLACRATEDCGGQMVSIGYPELRENPLVMPQNLRDKIQWKWVRPTQKEWNGMDDEMKQHIIRGGLELKRKVVDGFTGD